MTVTLGHSMHETDAQVEQFCQHKDGINENLIMFYSIAVGQLVQSPK